MALARIRTHFPEEVSSLSEALTDAGYTVEILRPNEFRIAPAELELSVDKLPVVEAWRHLPDVENLLIAPGTPESGDIRGSVREDVSREPLLVRFGVGLERRSFELSRWAQEQTKEIRAYIHELASHARSHAHRLRASADQLRQRWTPPRDYQAPVYPTHDRPVEGVVPLVDPAIEQARLQQEELRRQQIEQARLQQEENRRQQEILRRQEEVEKAEALRHQQEAAARELELQSRRAEENRRRAREAAEARALLEKQRHMEAMVQATEALRERVIRTELPKPRPEQRQRPRFLPRTRRERAFFQAGIVAFVVALSMAAVASVALHPRPAASAIPQAANVGGVSAEKPAVATPPAPTAAISVAAPTAAVAAEDKHQALAEAAAPQPKPSGARHAVVRHAGGDTLIAEDEVVVRRARPAKTQAKAKPTQIAHYSDLD